VVDDDNDNSSVNVDRARTVADASGNQRGR
jgi:hypothetical protein